jgi:hypothetical protein
MPSTGPTQFITMRGAVLTFAPTEADLDIDTSNVIPSCQIIDAHVTNATQTETAPATLCADAVDSIIGLNRSLELTAFQDWANPDGLCWYLETNNLEDAWFRLALTDGGDYTGVVTVAPIDYGGAAGSNLQGSVSLPARQVTATPPPGALVASSRTRKAAASAA